MGLLRINEAGLPTEKVSMWLCYVPRSHPRMAPGSPAYRGKERWKGIQHDSCDLLVMVTSRDLVVSAKVLIHIPDIKNYRRDSKTTQKRMNTHRN